MKTDVLIIGSGLIGSMTAKYLRDVRHMEVVMVDQKHPMGGSKCSFGVWKEGWVNKVIQDEYKDGLDLLDTFTGGVKEEEFLIKPKPYNMRSMGSAKYEVDPTIKKETFKRVDCSLILNEEFIEGTVLNIDKNRVTILKAGKEKEKVLVVAKHIVIAAGVWTTDILIENGLMNNLPYLDQIWGSVFKLKASSGQPLPQSQVREWSPYKQSVFVNMGNGRAMFGDGATLKNVKADDVRISPVSDRILMHMRELIGDKYVGNVTEILEGYRPYLNKKKTMTGKFVNQHSEWVISATGGAKNSTILCGHMAKEVWKLIKG